MKCIDYISTLSDLDLNRLIAFDLMNMDKDCEGSEYQDKNPNIVESLGNKAMVLTLNGRTELYDYCTSWDDIMPIASNLGVGCAMDIFGEYSAHSRDHTVKSKGAGLCRSLANVCAAVMSDI